MPESSRLPFANAESYRGYSFTQRACREGDWILYSFEEPVRCREMVLQTGYSHLTKTSSPPVTPRYRTTARTSSRQGSSRPGPPS